MARTVTLDELNHWDFFGSELDVEVRVHIEITGSEPRSRLAPWADATEASAYRVEVRRHGATDWHPFPLDLIPAEVLRRIAEEQASDHELLAAE